MNLRQQLFAPPGEFQLQALRPSEGALLRGDSTAGQSLCRAHRQGDAAGVGSLQDQGVLRGHLRKGVGDQGGWRRAQGDLRDPEQGSDEAARLSPDRGQGPRHGAERAAQDPAPAGVHQGARRGDPPARTGALRPGQALREQHQSHQPGLRAGPVQMEAAGHQGDVHRRRGRSGRDCQRPPVGDSAHAGVRFQLRGSAQYDEEVPGVPLPVQALPGGRRYGHGDPRRNHQRYGPKAPAPALPAEAAARSGRGQGPELDEPGAGNHRRHPQQTPHRLERGVVGALLRVLLRQSVHLLPREAGHHPSAGLAARRPAVQPPPAAHPAEHRDAGLLRAGHCGRPQSVPDRHAAQSAPEDKVPQGQRLHGNQGGSRMVWEPVQCLMLSLIPYSPGTSPSRRWCASPT